MRTAVAQTLPPRKVLREWVAPFEKKHAGRAYAIFIGDYALFFAASYGAVVLPLAGKVVCAVLIWITIARLFIIGHDACHGSYTASRTQNRWIGRLAFLPSLTPYRYWEVGHNMAHHGFANLVGKDHVWIPLSPEQYLRLKPWQKAWYRWTRGVLGAGLYYAVSLWWCELLKFRRINANKLEPDTVLAAGFAAAWIASIVLLALAMGEHVGIALTFAVVLPFIAWNYLMGLLIYVHHTHPEVRWYNDQNKWIDSRPYITATVHMHFPQWFSTALHHIMEHPAHHLSTNIPLYHLRAAQRRLAQGLGGQMVVQQFSFAWYRACVRTCKLYDFERQRWVGFEGV